MLLALSRWFLVLLFGAIAARKPQLRPGGVRSAKRTELAQRPQRGSGRVFGHASRERIVKAGKQALLPHQQASYAPAVVWHRQGVKYGTVWYLGTPLLVYLFFRRRRPCGGFTSI